MTLHVSEKIVAVVKVRIDENIVHINSSDRCNRRHQIEVHFLPLEIYEYSYNPRLISMIYEIRRNFFPKSLSNISV